MTGHQEKLGGRTLYGDTLEKRRFEAWRELWEHGEEQEIGRILTKDELEVWREERAWKEEEQEIERIQREEQDREIERKLERIRREDGEQKFRRVLADASFPANLLESGDRGAVPGAAPAAQPAKAAPELPLKDTCPSVRRAPSGGLGAQRSLPDINEWLAALEAAGCKPKRSGNGYSARCPAHEDRDPSLSLAEGDHQAVVVKCHKGCSFEAIRAALGFDRDRTPPDLHVVSSRPAPGQDPKPQPLPSGPNIRVWAYTDAEGKDLMAVVRRDLPGGKKRIHQWTPKDGGWIPVGLPEPRPLYRLPEIAQGEGPVLVVEGEKVVDAVLAAFPGRWRVTTWPGGHGQWAQADWTPLAGHPVAIVADADKGGRDAALGIAAHLSKLGCHVQTALPEGETGEDIADWIEADGAEAAHEKLKELLTEYEPEPEPQPEPEPSPEPERTAEAERAAKPGEATEHRAALGFTERHGETMRFDHDRGRWYQWVGDRWRHDRQRRALDYARQIAAGFDVKASKQTTVQRSGFAAGVERFAQADPVHAVEAGYFDSNRWLMGVPGGTLDLRTQKVIPADPDHRISLQAAAAPAATADCPLWKQFLKETFGGDEELIGFLQRFMGYSLTGDTREQVMVYAHGHGQNGKSVFFATWAGIMGEYAKQAPMEETFTQARGERHSTGVAGLAGARLVTATETEQGRAWAEALIKQLTGGEPVTARFMRQDFFTFDPVCKLAFQGNFLPALRSTDIAMRRRFRLITFPNQVPDDQTDPELAAKLRDEWRGIFRWMLDGLAKWMEKGLGTCEAVEAATNTYFDDNDTIGQWLQDKCQLHPDNKHSEPAAALFASWKDWCKKGGHDSGTATAFGLALSRKGLVKTKSSVNYWQGVQLVQKHENDPDQGFPV